MCVSAIKIYFSSSCVVGNIRINPFKCFCIKPIRILLVLWVIHRTDKTDRNYASLTDINYSEC